MFEISEEYFDCVNGAGFWYDLGRAFGVAAKGEWDYPMAGNYALGA